MAEGNIVGVRIVGRYQDQNIVNTIHYRIDAQEEGEDDILDQLCQAWETTLGAGWLSNHTPTYSLMGLRGFSLTGPNKIPGLVHIDDPGTVTGTAMPSPLCKTIILYTNSDNYRRRGRVMISGGNLLDFDTDDGSVVPQVLSFLDALGLTLIQTLVFGGNSFQPGLAPTATLPFEQFTGRKARKTPSLIRSRRIRGFAIG